MSCHLGPGSSRLTHQGVALVQCSIKTTSVNSPATPAAKGSVVLVYATGGGQTVPMAEDGRIATAAAAQAEHVSVQIGGMPAEVVYAGAAPGLVSGVMQVNVRVPESTASGLQPIEITVGTATSPPGVVIAIAGALQAAGTGPQIDARLQQLRRERIPAFVPDIPTDRDPTPANWLAIISLEYPGRWYFTNAGECSPADGKGRTWQHVRRLLPNHGSTGDFQ